MARLLSMARKIRNWLLVLIGIVIGVQPTIASKKAGPDIPQRLATVRSRMRELQPNNAGDTKRTDNGEVTRVAQWGNQWYNWNDWNNWNNWFNWGNWGNWGNY